MNLIASLKHTHKHHEHIVFWGPNHCGYTPVLEQAGHYGDFDSHKLNDGESYIAVPFDAVLALAVPTPFYKPGAQFYDVAGPVVDNTRANWNALLAASLPAGRVVPKPKPEVFRGKRRCIASEAV
jgi:hypothetical protein